MLVLALRGVAVGVAGRGLEHHVGHLMVLAGRGQPEGAVLRGGPHAELALRFADAIARRHDDVQTRCPKFIKRLRRGVLDRIGNADETCELAVDGEEHHACADPGGRYLEGRGARSDPASTV